VTQFAEQAWRVDAGGDAKLLVLTRSIRDLRESARCLRGRTHAEYLQEEGDPRAAPCPGERDTPSQPEAQQELEPNPQLNESTE
jgi:hypothetical protein